MLFWTAHFGWLVEFHT